MVGISSSGEQKISAGLDPQDWQGPPNSRARKKKTTKEKKKTQAWFFARPALLGPAQLTPTANLWLGKTCISRRSVKFDPPHPKRSSSGPAARPYENIDAAQINMVQPARLRCRRKSGRKNKFCPAFTHGFRPIANRKIANLGAVQGPCPGPHNLLRCDFRHSRNTSPIHRTSVQRHIGRIDARSGENQAVRDPVRRLPRVGPRAAAPWNAQNRLCFGELSRRPANRHARGEKKKNPHQDPAIQGCAGNRPRLGRRPTNGPSPTENEEGWTLDAQRIRSRRAQHQTGEAINLSSLPRTTNIRRVSVEQFQRTPVIILVRQHHGASILFKADPLE